MEPWAVMGRRMCPTWGVLALPFPSRGSPGAAGCVEAQAAQTVKGEKKLGVEITSFKG